MATAARPEFLSAGGYRLECLRYGPRPDQAPTLVFLHEGLGSAAMWRDFPEKLAAATGCGALVYSRAGYGGSDPVPLPRPITYMHDEGLLVLPDLLAAAGIGDHVLIGHSDGASIAIVNGGGTRAAGLKGLVLEAAHVFIEDISVRSIAAAAESYRTTDLPDRLRRWHGANTDCAFWGWNRAWLDPAFRHWNIEEYLPAIRVPTLAIQGEGDEYGTVAQLDAIRRQAGGGAEILLLPDCGHSPHRDQPAATLAAMTRFIAVVLK